MEVTPVLVNGTITHPQHFLVFRTDTMNYGCEDVKGTQVLNPRSLRRIAGGVFCFLSLVF